MPVEKNYLIHRDHKYISRYMGSNGKWRYLYATKKTHNYLRRTRDLNERNNGKIVEYSVKAGYENGVANAYQSVGKEKLAGKHYNQADRYTTLGNTYVNAHNQNNSRMNATLERYELKNVVKSDLVKAGKEMVDAFFPDRKKK